MESSSLRILPFAFRHSDIPTFRHSAFLHSDFPAFGPPVHDAPLSPTTHFSPPRCTSHPHHSCVASSFHLIPCNSRQRRISHHSDTCVASPLVLDYPASPATTQLSPLRQLRRVPDRGWGARQTFRFAPSLPRLTARAPPVHEATGGHGFARPPLPPHGNRTHYSSQVSPSSSPRAQNLLFCSHQELFIAIREQIPRFCSHQEHFLAVREQFPRFCSHQEHFLAIREQIPHFCSRRASFLTIREQIPRFCSHQEHFLAIREHYRRFCARGPSILLFREQDR